MDDMMDFRPRLLQSSLAIAAVFLLWQANGYAKTIEEVADIPVTVTNMYGTTFTRPIKVTIFRDDKKERAPFLILNHGRPANASGFAKMARVKYSKNAKYFVSKGFAVFVPTRMGYGVTGGNDAEYSGSCSSRNYPPAYEAAAQQSLTVIDFARTQPYVDPGRGLVVGQSFGGATAIAVAAKNVKGVVATVNFAGGGGGNPDTSPENPCRPDLLAELFASYGARSRIPTLWLYSENDRYFGKTYPREWFEAFRKQGGRGEFVQLPAYEHDGHPSFTKNPGAWKPAFEKFLQSVGF